MEAEPLLPDNTAIDPTKPPPEANFPKPDFTEVDNSDKPEPPLLKPTFKNVLQAKKRLQAFSSTRPGSLPSSPQKVKSSEEKTEEIIAKKTPKKGHSHDDKAKAVIKEIEEMKKEEQAFLELQRQSYKRSRSRSRSTDRGRFKKVAKKTRNYRRRAQSPERPKKSPKKQKKYPKNWREFYETGATFDVNRDFDIATPSGNNELIRQVLFESPSLPIVPFKAKTVNREEKIVPFEYLRYTRTKPVIPYSANPSVKDMFISKKLLLAAIPKNFAAVLDKLYTNSVKFAPLEIGPKTRKSRLWYLKVWSGTENECKVLETSVGLSFLQSYTGEEEEGELVDFVVKTGDKKPKKEKGVEDNPTKEETDEKTEKSNDEMDSKKKKHKKESESEKKKKKKKHKEKKVEGTGDSPPKKKMKKDKTKKSEKRKEKKKKKSKDKKKVQEKDDKPTKQQVIEELKEIEEKLAKKKEDVEKKTENPSRKKKLSEREEDSKRTKHDKIKEENETKFEHALKNKLKKMVAKQEPESDSKKLKEEVSSRKKKSRWSEDFSEQLSTSDLNIIAEIAKNDELNAEDLKVIEEIKASTPDTDEYHSHWESDDDVSSSVPRNSLKLNRSWESDEELFERSYNRDIKPAETYTSLEIPLNIKNFSRRSERDEKPFSVAEELKLLEIERQSLSEERKKLELEKQKIIKLQEEAKLDRDDQTGKETKDVSDGLVKIKKENPEMNDFSIDSLNNSLLSTVSSTESNFPTGVLENQYEEFIKAVSSESSIITKKKERRSSDSSSWSSDSDHKKKKRKKKKKKKKKTRECDGLLLGKGNNIFNEFDIPVPSDLPEMIPTPVPVPSPILPLDKILPLTAPPLLLPKPIEKSVIEPPPKAEERKKPFVFSSITLPTKKTPLVDNSKLKLDDDSDSADFTDKFVRKPELKEPTKDEEEDKKDEPKEDELPPPIQTEIQEKLEEKPKPAVESIQNVPLPSEKPESKPPDPKIKRSHSLSPARKSKTKRRSRSSSRDHDSKRRSPIRRREPTPPRRRHASPRRRSPPRRRCSPRRRSPSPRRRSPRRRRRTPSFSPPRSRNGRKRTPSPRRRASPLNSPLDGFKKSVADSTISDDMLPQPNPDDYNDSPNSYGNKYYKKRGSLSPQLSPKRISLDDRINQVLGLEKNEMMAPPVKPPDIYQNYGYNSVYGQQYPQFGQYVQPKNDYVAPSYGGMMYTQPPPPVAKTGPTPTKVLQVGNILQVVPSDEVPVLENKTPDRSQKIVQVGNMLQIVPAVISTPQPIPEPQPVPPIQIPEKPSAEALMKQKNAERKAEREKRRQERDRRRKEKEQKRKEREKRKQMKIKMKTENMIKRAIQIEAEALANEDVEDESPSIDPPIAVIVSTPPTCKGILLQGGSKKRKSVQFADGVRPGEGTSPSGGEELSSPPPPTKLPKEKRYKKKTKKKKIRVKVVKKVPNLEEEDEDDDEEDNYFANLAPPPPPPGSPPPHVFPTRVKTHTINNVHQYVGNIMQTNSSGFAYPPPMQVVMNGRHQPPPGYMQATYPTDVNTLSHPTYQGVSSHH